MSHKLIEHVRKVGGAGLEFLTAAHLEARFFLTIASLSKIGLPAPMSDGRWRASDVEALADSLSRKWDGMALELDFQLGELDFQLGDIDRFDDLDLDVVDRRSSRSRK